MEVEASDLALDADGARKLLRSAGVNVSKTEAAELADSTEGWPVGLYLAALSLQAQRTSSVPAISFTGDDRFVTDYVRSELLSRLPRERVRFLTRTSVLSRLSGPLCNAVLGRKGSARILESMEESNLLLIPLDRRREWFRYHHLFRDVLRSELHQREPDAVADLHLRAADWFEANGLVEEAMEHARGRRRGTSRGVVRAAILPLNRSGRFETLHRWLGYLGAEMVARHPSVAVSAAWVSALSGEPRAADRWSDLALRAPGLVTVRRERVGALGARDDRRAHRPSRCDGHARGRSRRRRARTDHEPVAPDRARSRRHRLCGARRSRRRRALPRGGGGGRRGGRRRPRRLARVRRTLAAGHRAWRARSGARLRRARVRARASRTWRSIRPACRPSPPRRASLCATAIGLVLVTRSSTPSGPGGPLRTPFRPWPSRRDLSWPTSTSRSPTWPVLGP